MHQQDGWTHHNLVCEGFGAQQTARKGNNARNLVLAARGDMQRHHRTLGKAEQHDLFGQHIFVHHKRVQKRVQIVDGLHHAAL